MMSLASFAAVMAMFGLGQSCAGLVLVRRFRARAALPPGSRPPVTVLKPLFGSEPLLEQALSTVCGQHYDTVQIVFGVQRPSDPAVHVVRRLQARFPHCDISLVVDPTTHGRNHKVANLINMLPAARHDILVIADSDVHAEPDYLARVVDALQQPGVGLVTTLYAGLPASSSLAGSLGATAITHSFLPGALMARALGRQDCLGATMALRRATLEAVGGLAAIADDMADDAALGRLVRNQGLAVALASTVPATTVPEIRLRALFHHELRWARTIVSLVPFQFGLSVLQYSLAWAVLSVLLSGAEEWSIAVMLAVWAGRAALGRGVDRALALTQAGMSRPAPIWLLPLRDVLSVAVVLLSYASDQVQWRGEVLRVGGRTTPIEGMNPLSLGSKTS